MGGRIFATFFSSFISILLIAMMNLEDQIENPFKFENRDTVRVKEELELCREILDDTQHVLQDKWHEELLDDWDVLETPMTAATSRTHRTPKSTISPQASSRREHRAESPQCRATTAP